MTAYEDTVELTGKGNVENIAELSLASVELTGKGVAAVDPGGLSFQDVLEFTGTGHIFSGPYIDWTYKRGVKVTNYTGGELIDYPVEVVLTTENFDYAKCEPDGSDIRFGAGNDALPYWIEDWNYGGVSRIWINVSTITEGFNVRLHIYYGKAGEADESNGGNVWNVAFDHFSGDTLDPTKWEEFGTPTGSLTITVHDGYVQIHSASGQSRQVGLKSINDTLLGTNFRILTRQKTTRDWTASYAHQYSGQIVDPSNMNGIHFAEYWSGHCPSSCHIYHRSAISGVATAPDYSIYDLDWHRYLLKKLSTTHFKAIQDTESELTNTTNIYAGDAPFRFLTQHDNYYMTTHDLYMDYIAITDKYASPDPIASLVSEEEEEEISLIAQWTLFQSAEIEGKGDPTVLLSFQPLLEPVATGGISIDVTSVFHESHEFTGVGDFLVPHVHIFANLDSFLTENFSIRKTIQDPYWKFKGDVDDIAVPAYFKTLRIIEPDHEGTDRCIFLGFIPGAGFDLAVANDKATLNGFDQAWYLQAQYVPTSLRVTDEDTNPASIINTLLGDASWANVTGIEPYCINTVTDWSAIKKSFIFDTKASKWKAIQEICAYCHHVFLVKWRKTGDDQYYSCAYFVHEDELDDYLDLPGKATITNPDDHLISRVKKGDGGSTEYPVQIEEAETEKYNRITVSGIDIETGTWYHKTVESPGVISGDEIPIEFKYESSDLNTQEKVDDLADALYLFYHTIAKYYYASFNSRMDFELYQKLEFIDFPDIPDELMRITGLTFDCQKTQNIVTVLFTSDQKLSDLRKLLRSMGRRYIPDWLDLTKIAVGTILEISESGKTALVQIDKDDTIVRARILNP